MSESNLSSGGLEWIMQAPLSFGTKIQSSIRESIKSERIEGKQICIFSKNKTRFCCALQECKKKKRMIMKICSTSMLWCAADSESWCATSFTLFPVASLTQCWCCHHPLIASWKWRPSKHSFSQGHFRSNNIAFCTLCRLPACGCSFLRSLGGGCGDTKSPHAQSARNQFLLCTAADTKHSPSFSCIFNSPTTRSIGTQHNIIGAFWRDLFCDRIEFIENQSERQWTAHLCVCVGVVASIWLLNRTNWSLYLSSLCVWFF